MAENLIRTKISMTTEGASEAVEQYAALQAEAEKTAESIQQADDAAKGLNTTLAATPAIPAEGAAAVQGVKTQAAELSKSVKDVSAGFGEAGQAGQQLSSVLDKAVPGLGQISQAILSMNPAAVIGTIAITGIVTVLGQMQKQADAARKAIEDAAKASTKAESDRVASETTIQQRTNQALDGSKPARESLIKDFAQATNQAANLGAQLVSNQDRQKEQQARLTEITAQAFDQFKTGHIDQTLVDESDRLKTSLAELKTEELGLNTQVSTNTTTFGQLRDAAKAVNITAEEQSAVMKAVTQGADGATAALDKLWQTADAGPSILENAGKALSDVLHGLGDGLVKAAQSVKDAEEKAAKDRADAEKALIDTNEKLTSVESDRGKALADRAIEDQRNTALNALNDRLAAAQAYDTALAKNKKIAEVEQQGHAADLQSQSKFMDDNQKLLSTYLKAEQTATEDYSRERVRKLEDLYNTLGNLASQRDVAGFVNARRSGMTDISRGDEDAGLSAQRRRDTYQQQAKDLQTAFAKETALRQTQLQQRLQQEQQAGQQQITQASIVQKSIADLRTQYAQADFRARQLAEDQTYRQTVQILQKKRDDELKITAGAAAGVINLLLKAKDTITRLGSSAAEAGARGIPHYADGTPYVPRTGLAVVHEGEKITSAADNARAMRGGNRSTPNYVFQMSVGEHVSQSDLAAVKDSIVGAITSFGANSNN